MKKTVSRFVTLSLLLLLTLSAVFPASAMSHTGMSVATSTVAPRSEELEYYYRIYEGKYQYRIWSVTYGKWITDWIDC